MAVSPYGSIMKAPATLAETVVYTSSGTFEKANYPGIKYVRVRAVGGGGGGGAVGPSNSGGGGGGGGGYAESVLYADELAASETVTVGVGGAGGDTTPSNGVAGGTSAFGSHLSATGGDGGGHTNAVSPHGGLGGVGTGDIVSHGGGGGGGSTSDAQGGAGGSSFFGGGARGLAVSGADEGQPGNAWGGGGGGANRTGGGNRAGGNGAQGIVIVDVYVQEQGLVGDTGFVHVNQFPKGLLARAIMTTSYTGISAATLIPDLKVTVDLPAGRHIKVVADFQIDGDTTNNIRAEGRLVEVAAGGNTQLQNSRVPIDAAAYGVLSRAHVEALLTPSAGSHTYQVEVGRSIGTVSVGAASTVPAHIYVEDLGPA